MKPTKKVKPSRARYEASHRVVSARLDRELHEKLKAHLATNGESFAAFVKAAFEEDQAKVAARVEELAGRRSGLQKQLRELALAVADKGRQLKASVEEERTRLLRQMEADVEGERQRRFNALEQAFRQEKVSCEWQLSLLDKDVVRLSKEVADKEEHRARLDMELANRERLMRQLTEQALAELRRQGVPYLVCLGCYGYTWARFWSETTKAIVKGLPASAGATRSVESPSVSPPPRRQDETQGPRA